MSGSFRGHSFLEGGEGATRFPLWGMAAKVAVIEIPGANADVIQRFGRKSRTLSLTATCTASELSALYADVEQAGDLIIASETRGAILESIDAHEVLAGRDVYVATLLFRAT